MPWYDYQCEKCGAVFEIQRGMEETGKVKCHSCGSTRTVQVYAPAPIVFKGSGFYVTDSSKTSSSTISSSKASEPLPEVKEAVAAATADSKSPKKKKTA